MAKERAAKKKPLETASPTSGIKSVVSAESEAPSPRYIHEPASMDDRGRIRFPDTIRSQFGARLVLVYQAMEGTIKVFSQEGFDAYEDGLYSMFSETNELGSFYREIMVSNARAVTMDSANRVMIPADLRDTAKVPAGKVYFVANRNEILIYSEAAYKSRAEKRTEFQREERQKNLELFEQAMKAERNIQKLIAGDYS